MKFYAFLQTVKKDDGITTKNEAALTNHLTSKYFRSCRKLSFFDADA